MKKYFKLFIFIMICFICTGCVKFNGVASINSFKKMNIHIDYALLNELDEYKIFNDQNIDDMKNFGYKIKEYKDDKYTGYSIDVKIRNIDKVSVEDDINFYITSLKDNKPEKVFKVKKGFFSNKYTANFVFDSTDTNPQHFDDSLDRVKYLCEDGSVIEVNTNEENGRVDCYRVSNIEIENALSDKPLSHEELEKKYNKLNDLKFTVKLNKVPISNDADIVSKNKKELTWNLNSNGLTNIDFVFKEINYGNCFLIVISIIVIVSLVIYLIKKFGGKHEKK